VEGLEKMMPTLIHNNQQLGSNNLNRK